LVGDGMSMAEGARRVAVTIATRGRHAGCRRLVDAVLKQDLPADWNLRVIVVDNNRVPAALRLPGDPRIEVVHEPVPGIPLARNRGIEQALPWADAIVFVDDDEIPAEQCWLRRLVSHLDLLGADVVSGPVLPSFPPGTPKWLRTQPLFYSPTRPTGTKLATTATNNTVCRARVFAGGLRFSTSYIRTGGSDTDIFYRMFASGATIGWAKDAVVHATVPPDRANVAWVLKRSFRIGGNRAQVLDVVPNPRTAILRYLLGSLVEIAAIPVAVLMWFPARRYGLWLMARGCRGLGFLAAAMGFRLHEYR